MLFSSGLQQLIKRLFKVVQAQKRLQIEKSAGITVAGNLVTDMGSASSIDFEKCMVSQ